MIEVINGYDIGYFMSEYNQSFNKTDSSAVLDIHIGAKVKHRRGFLGLSQEKLADCLGVTFQQVQKYEKGVNRISASTLYNIAKALHVDVAFFFDGFNSAYELNDDNTPSYKTDASIKKETRELLKSYYKIENKAIRKKVLELIKSLGSVTDDTNKVEQF